MNPLIDIIGESPPIVGLRHQIDRLLNVGGRRLPPILIEGETGTGKGLLARSIHRASARADGPFVDVNCSAIPESLVESELFGFERSAFTDARHAKPGLFQTAHGGTIFLDEIGTLPPAIQAKLLKAIEDREVRRLGATRSEPFDAWIMAATNEDLKSAVDARRFRADLYHRIAAVMLWMAPLRTRGRDVLLLAERFLERMCAEYGRPPKSLTTEACVALLAYPWPGNVRELANLMERVALLSEGTSVTAEMLGLPSAGAAEARRPGGPTRPAEARPVPETTPDDSPREAFERSERERLLAVLHEVGGNISRAATRLGVPRNTLRYRLARLGLGVDDPRITRRRDVALPPLSSVESWLPSPRRPAEPAAAAAAPETRVLTFLRVAPRARSETMGPSAESRIFEVVGDKIRSFGGHVESLEPGLAVTVFGVEAPDDGPAHAVHAAVAIRQAGERERERGMGFGIVASIHVATCRVTITPEGPEIHAGDIEPAAAVLDALAADADLGAIVLSDAASRLVERRFDLVRMSPGPDGLRAARLGERERPGLEPGDRAPSPFVGRARELATLQELLGRVEQGMGQVVGLVGEPGIGKTRLVQELRQTLDRADIAWLETKCETYGIGIPYLPLCGLLRQQCGIGEFDTSEVMRDKVGWTLHHAAIDADRWAPFVLHLLGVKRGTEAIASLSPEAVQTRTAEALAEIWFRTSQRRPLVIVIEDLQSIDKASEELLASIAGDLSDTAILLLTTYRPGYTPSWMHRSHATQVTVPRLATADALRIVESVTGHATIDAAPVLAKAEGNPLFLEEVTRALAEERDGAGSSLVPDTVQDVIVERLRRLSPAATELLQAAAVLGREVSLKLLFVVWPGGDDPRPPLAELKRLELLVEQSRGEQATVRFKHVLTQEVVYRRLPEAGRATLHAAAGRVLESIYAGRADEACDVLAYHYGRSGEAAKAVSWLSRAAQRAFRLNALEDTLETLRRAGEHVAKIDDFVRRERLAVEVVHQQVFSLVFLGRLPMAVELLDQHTGAVERMADAALAARHFFWLGFCHCLLGNLERAEQDGDRALSEAWRGSDRQAMGKAHFVLALRAYSGTEPTVGVEHGEQATALLDKSIEPGWLGLACWVLGANYGELGEHRRAIECERRAIAIAEATGDRRPRSYALTHLGFLHAALGECAAGVPACEQGLELAPDPFTAAVATGYLGYAHLQNGAPARAIELLTGAIDFLSLFHHRQLTMWFTALVAEAHLLDGQVEPAHAKALEAHEAAMAAHFPAGVNYAEWVLGRIAQARGDAAGVERWRASFHDAETKVARGFWRGRELLDLARCAHAQGARDRAAAYLRSAYDVFAAADAPSYVARACSLAQDLGLTLGEPAR